MFYACPVKTIWLLRRELNGKIYGLENIAGA